MSFREKVAALRDFGVDRVLRIRFDAALSAMGATEFARRVFVDGLGARHVVTGDDSHFGHNREGDIHLLRELGERHGFSVESTPTLLVDGERVSSTRIRGLLEAGDFVAAERLLGHPYSITGRVMVGQRLGRTLEVPTANLQLYRLRSPLSGVYAVEVLGVGPTPQPGVANVGTRPTIGDLTRAILEVHILDFSGDLYHRTISVVFRRKLREERRFDSLAALKQQIHRDLDAGRSYFAGAL
jgi:riboflavin kinase/FMN adenylyltransferase